MDETVVDARTDPFGELVEQMLCAVVFDLMDGIEAEPIHVELLDPVESIVNGELAHHFAAHIVVVHRITPGSFVMTREDLRSVRGEVVSVRAEVVVDHIQDDHHVACVSCLDERFEVFGPAIAGVRRIEENAVISPVPEAGEVRDRHDLNPGDTQVAKMVQLLDGG